MLKLCPKKLIDFTVRCSCSSVRKAMLKVSLYVSKSIRNTRGSYTYDIHQRMNVHNILPVNTHESRNEVALDDICNKTEKCKIRIVYPSGTAWNCIGSVYDELIKDKRYDVVIITENYPTYIDVMNEKGCKFIKLDSYDVKVDRPDVLVLTSYSSTPNTLNFPGLKKYVGTIISLFPNIVINEFDMAKHWAYVYKAYENCEPDYYLFDSLPFQYSKDYIVDAKAVHMGNPQFDELYYKLTDKTAVDKRWDKLNGKKVFLWATDHGINEYYPIVASSVDLYIKSIIEYFAAHPELGLIIRFHPFLIREMEQSGIFWSGSDFKEIVAYCEKTQNVVWDVSPDFCSAFKRCDALLVDPNCGFTVSFLTTGKPICRMLRNDIKVKLIHPELQDCYYYSKSVEDLEHFIENVVLGRDPLFTKRQEIYRKSIKHFDGCNGRRVKSFIDKVSVETNS